MKKTSNPWTMKQVVRMSEKGSLDFNYPIQRKGGQWDELQASLLIHSLAGSYPIPPILILKQDDTSYVLDGKQRLTNIINFINGEFSLHMDTPSVRIEDIGEEFEIAGKKFEELPEAVQDEITGAGLSFNRIEEATDEEIEELFFRWNNGTPLSSQQKARAKMGTYNAMELEEILKHEFMQEKTKFTALQRRRSDDEAAIIQSLILLSGYDYKDFVAKNLLKYATEMKEVDLSVYYTELKEILDYLNDAFEGKSALFRKIHFPMMIMMARKAISLNMGAGLFYDWAEDFTKAISNKPEGAKVQTEYKEYTGAGSVKKDKIQGRLKEMDEHFEKFFEGVDFEVPEEEIKPVIIEADQTEEQTEDQQEEELIIQEEVAVADENQFEEQIGVLEPAAFVSDTEENKKDSEEDNKEPQGVKELELVSEDGWND